MAGGPRWQVARNQMEKTLDSRNLRKTKVAKGVLVHCSVSFSGTRTAVFEVPQQAIEVNGVIHVEKR